MLKRTLFIEQSFHVSTRLEQLVLKNKKNDEEKSVPIEDIGFVVFENGECTFSLQAIAKLNANNAAVIFCDTSHMPASMLLTLDGNDVQSQMFAHQLNASEPLKKQLWQQTIKAKINNQSALLQSLGKETAFLKRCADNVKSGDTTNEEGKASRYYWQNLFDDLPNHPSTALRMTNTPVTLSEERSDESKSDYSQRSPSTSSPSETSLRTTKRFTRNREGDPPNNLLNYGYIVLRAAVARALTGSGLLPTLGIHHHNKYNAFCLADDIMEPYRPWVDKLVHTIIHDTKDCSLLTTNLKTRLLWVLQHDVVINEAKSPLHVALSQTTASLAECFAGERKTIKYPEML